MPDPVSRRTLLASAALLAGRAAAAAGNSRAQLPICAFSKHFQWTDWKGTAGLCAEIGYDGVDLTVRKGGHVLPERVADDLPRAVEAVQAAGLAVPMITAGIVDVHSEHAEAIVKTASALGIKRYRWGGFRYDTSKSIPQQIAEFKTRSKALADMNKQYGACAMYHTHSGIGQFGASMWDIWMVVKDLDTSAVGVNLDIGHATVEGGFGGWINSTRLLLPVTRGIAVKDFRWERTGAQWRPHWCALGDGMVNFGEFFRMVKAAGFAGPLQLHMEYDELGGADSGKTQMSITKEQFLAIAKRDLQRLREVLRETGIS